MNTTFLSLTRPFTTPIHLLPPSAAKHRHHLRPLKTGPIRSSTDDINNRENTAPTIPPPPEEGVEIRFRRGSRRRSREQPKEGSGQTTKKSEPPKNWEDMTLTEKAIELYVGEKGLLFWLNKSAYASIYIIIGGWILFRFVGPALNLYQLDAPPLSPTSVLKGS